MSMPALADAEPKVRRTPQINPDRVTVDVAGLARKSVVARLPEGAIADDLKNSFMWEKVQRSSRALCAYDAVLLISYDQTWAAEALVSHADNEGATLAGVKIIQTPQRSTALYRDDTYAVRWNGFGYFVERIKDGHAMTQAAPTKQMAERDLRNLYPKRA